MIKKQPDYGNPKLSPSRDVVGGGCTLTNKVIRLGELILSGHLPQNESIRDTAVDIRNYRPILLMLIDSL